MIKNVSHTLTGTAPDTHNNPAGFALALAVAHELHAPALRAPEVASAPAPRGAARRTAAARTRRTARS
ncbi:hypothetical protein AB0D14_34805 [Streptomyces sp. NPDC048484]|uniref:hypothetical protein n=1 Tax=Streptomyces sp. NPDC048484 TaxID=3155146 RepID=UPI00341D2073